jgi:hypothetical protein
MDDWLALSDVISSRPQAREPMDLSKGKLVVELALPLAPAAVLLQWRAGLAGQRASFGLFHEETLGMVILIRQDEKLVRHVLSGPLPDGIGTARLEMQFDVTQNRWEMSLEKLGDAQASKLFAMGTGSVAIGAHAIRAIAAGDAGTIRHPAVRWFGMTARDAQPDQGQWFGMRTPFPTTRGLVAAAHLTPSDQLVTRDGSLVGLVSVETRTVPTFGSFAPVILRAPFYRLTESILVSPSTSLVLFGPETEYLFDDDHVLVRAEHLVDDHGAVREQSRQSTSAVHLMVERPAVVTLAGTLVAMPSKAPLPIRRLEKFEAQTVISLIRQRGLRWTA